MGLESPSSRAERLARMVAIWGRVPTLAETITKIDAVNVQGVKDMAAATVVQPMPTLALYGPVSGAPTLERLRERLIA